MTIARMFTKIMLCKKRGSDKFESKTASLILRDFYRNGLPNALTFLPYFLAIESKAKGDERFTSEIIAQRLAAAKERIEKPRKKPSPYPYDDAGLDFDFYRRNDDEFNSCDTVTFRAVIDHKITPEEQKALEDELWIEFRDPYCDGRDCTGAPMTAWLRFLKCSDRTIVLHRICFDV